MTTETGDSIWVKTMPTVEGDGYVVTLECDDDTARVLNPTEAMVHALGVMEAVARAEYDAAVLRQFTKMDIDVSAVAEMVRQLRADRPPLDPAATAPLWLEPGVNKDFEPFLVVSVKGAKVGQWSVADARGHAVFVIEAVVGADLDAGYARTLRSVLGMDKDLAARVIDGLGEHRTAT